MMAAVISGQGRMLVLFGQDLNRDVITEVCYFLCGECSYRIKAMNPGMDLLMAVNWKESILWYPEPVKNYLPSGMAFLLSDAVRPDNEIVNNKKMETRNDLLTLDVNQDTGTDENLLKILLVFIVPALLIYLVGRFLLKK